MLLFLAVRNNLLAYSPFSWCSQTVQFFEKVRRMIHVSTEGARHWGGRGEIGMVGQHVLSFDVFSLTSRSTFGIYSHVISLCSKSCHNLSFLLTPQEAKEIGDVSTQTNQWTYSLSALNEICILTYTRYYFIIYHQKILWTFTWICSC